MDEADWKLAVSLSKRGAAALPRRLMENRARPPGVEIYARLVAAAANEIDGLTADSVFAERRITMHPDGRTVATFVGIMGQARLAEAVAEERGTEPERILVALCGDGDSLQRRFSHLAPDTRSEFGSAELRARPIRSGTRFIVEARPSVGRAARGE